MWRLLLALLAVAPSPPANLRVTDTPTAMAITRIGSVTAYQAGTGNTGSTSITVPADAEIIIVSVTGYAGVANYFSGGAITIGGAALTDIAGGDASTSYFQGSMSYKVSPATGTQTLAWDWIGSGTLSNAALISYAFYKGIDTASTVRDSHGMQDWTPYASKSLTAQTGDMVVAAAFTYASAERSFTWTNASEVTELTAYGNSDGAWAEASPSGNVVITASATSGEDGGLMTIVLKPASGSSPQTLSPTAATSTAATSAPTVTAGAVTQTPATAAATASASDASRSAVVTVTPDTSTATASASDSTLTVGAVTVTPATAAASGASLDPAITAGAVTVTTDASTATGAASDATLSSGAVTLTPDTATSTGAASDSTLSVGVATLTASEATATALASDTSITSPNQPQTLSPDAATATTVANDGIISATASLTADTATSTASASDSGLSASITLIPDSATATSDASDPTITAGSVTVTLGSAAATASANDAPITAQSNQAIAPGEAAATASASDCILQLPPIVLPQTQGGGGGWRKVHGGLRHVDRSHEYPTPEKPKRKAIELQLRPTTNLVLLSDTARAYGRGFQPSIVNDDTEVIRLRFDAEVEDDDMEAMRLLLDVI